MTESAPTLPYAPLAPTGPDRDLRVPGALAVALGTLRLVTLLVVLDGFIGPNVFRDFNPQRFAPRPSPGSGVLRLLATAVETVGAAMLVVGGAGCLRRAPRGRGLLTWGAALVLLALAWAAAAQLFALLRMMPPNRWPYAVLVIVQPAAWDAGFPALLWVLGRRARPAAAA